jgi:hypothetical protein
MGSYKFPKTWNQGYLLSLTKSNACTTLVNKGCVTHSGLNPKLRPPEWGISSMRKLFKFLFLMIPGQVSRGGKKKSKK